MEKLFAKINAKDFARVMPFRALGDVRYYLQGVCIEPADGGAVIVATNGHVLGAMFSADSYIEKTSIIDVTPGLAAAVKAAAKDQTSILRLTTADTQLEVVKDFRVVFVKPDKPLIDGKFPDWRKIIPNDELLKDGLPSSYNAKYLKQALDAVLENPTRNFTDHGVKFSHVENKDGAAIIRGGGDFTCIVMPMRTELTSIIPSWMRPVIPAQAA